MTTAPRKTIVPIRSFEELSKLIMCQKIVANRVREELFGLAEQMVAPTSAEEELRYGINSIQAEKDLLADYVRRPSLSESSRVAQPLAGQWGATFGVTTILRESILQHLRGGEAAFQKHHAYILTRLLMELQHPTGEDGELAEPVWASLRMKGGENVKLALQKLLEMMILVTVEYGIVDSADSGYSLTPTGTRLLVHLIDAQRYIEDVVEAHTRFQTANPRRVGAV